MLHTCVLLVSANNNSSSSCRLGRRLRVEGRGVCCCDWTWVRGNATHAWTHRPAHSCVKNTLLLFSGHRSGRDPKTLGQGVVGSRTPLCAVLSRDLAKLSWASCMQKNSIISPSDVWSYHAPAVWKGEKHHFRSDQCISALESLTAVESLTWFAFGCEWRNHPLSGWPSRLMWFKQVSGVIHWGLPGRIGLPDEDVAWWCKGSWGVRPAIWAAEAPDGPAACYCTSVELHYCLLLLLVLVTWAHWLCIPTVQCITVASSGVNTSLNRGDVEIHLIMS